MPTSVISVDQLDLDNAIQQDATDTSNYFADNGIIRADFIQTGNTVKYTSKGRTITWVPQNMRYIDSLGMEDSIYSVQDVPLETKGNYARFNRTMPDIDDWFIVDNDRIKHQILVQGFQRDPMPYLSDPIQFAVGGQLLFDADLTVRSMGMTLTGAFQTADSIQLCDGDDVIFTMPQVIAFDSKYERAETTGFYNVTTNEAGNLQFDIVLDNAWVSDVARVYPLVIDPTVIVSSAYDTSGNGGRKIVRLSNNWIVVGFTNTSTLEFYVSKDNGQTFSTLTYVNMPTSNGNWAICSSGTNVYVLFNSTATGQSYSGQVNFVRFDATTATWTNLANTSTPDTGQSSMGNGVSLTIDGNGKLWATWCSKNPTYPSSFNIRVSSSTDGGTTWATTQYVAGSFALNNSTAYARNPCIVVRGNNSPVVIYERYAGTNNSYDIYAATFNGSAWTENMVCRGASAAGTFYTQSNPCAAVDNNDAIYVAWCGEDATYTTTYQIKYSKSTDGGSTWSAMINLTTQTGGQNQLNPSITIDANTNNLYVFYMGSDATITTTFNIFKLIYSGGAWQPTVRITSDTTGSGVQSPQTLWSKFNMNSSDAMRYMYEDITNAKIQYDSITLNSPPNAPILTAHGNFDATVAQTLAWTFSDPDAGNTQSAYQLQIVDVATGSTVIDTGKVASTVSSYSLAANALTNGKQYQWRVMTWDNSGAQGPYSSYSTFTTAAAPTVTITAPTANQVIATSSETVGFSYSDPANNAQQSYDVQLYDSTGNTLIEDSGTINGTNNQYTLKTVLANNTTYVVKVKATNSQGITSATVSQTFLTSFTAPATPTLAVSPQMSYAAISFTNPAPSGSEPTVAYNDLHRRNTGGSESDWMRIATNLANNATYQDYGMASGQSYDYKVTANGNNQTTSDSAVATNNSVALPGGMWIHDVSDPAGTIVKLPYFEQSGGGGGQTPNTEQWTPTATEMQFSGRKYPVVEFGEAETFQVTKGYVTIVQDEATWNSLTSLLRNQTTLCLRDTRGRVVFGNVTAGYQETDLLFGRQVTIQITQTDYSEVV